MRRDFGKSAGFNGKGVAFPPDLGHTVLTGGGQPRQPLTQRVMTDSDIHWTFAAAYQYGGGFYQALAQAGMKADPINKKRILNAFPELIENYGTDTKFHRNLRSGASS